MHYGIDVSSFQGEVNWSRVASDGIEFAHAKATEGVSLRDPFFERNRLGAREFGIHFGGYHFARPDHNPPRQEAFFFRTVAGRPSVGDVRMVLDLEKGVGNLTVWAGAFLAELEHVTGVRPMWYSGKWFIDAHVNRAALAGYPYWDSSYGRNDGVEHPAALPNAEHQFTSNAVVRGVIGRVDKNSAPSLAPLLVSGPTPPPKPKPSPSPSVPDVTPAPEPKNGNPFTRPVWPTPVPRWFWQWAQWKLDGEAYQRPWDAPFVIPPWAWIRLQQLEPKGTS